jgi:methionyl-tRNA synthetase
MHNNDHKHYITTPIYYVNFKPHIGTSYTTILADAAARWARMRGQDTLLVTGSDEHSQNIADLAAAAGLSPREYCDQIIPKFRDCWSLVQIQDYRFERTSEERHHELVRTFWQRIYDRGDVYKGSYSGWYHTSDNRFLDEEEVPENPQADPRLKFLTEEAYYFRLSSYQAWLEEFHEANPEFVVPDFRRNEMLARIGAGLKDICISRSSTDWGIKMPWDGEHVFYVWIEALLTYLTGSGFDIAAYEKTFVDGKSSETVEPLWETTRSHLATQPATNYWPCDLHLMAKDIPWFHAVIWPAMLRSYGAPLPKQLLVHGYWQFDGSKMSKSLGNVVDPYDAAKLAGVDGLRYFLLREAPAGLDGNFSFKALLDRYNYDLVNDLGNLVHRTVSMLHQLFGGEVPPELAVTGLDEALEAKQRETVAAVERLYPQYAFSEALQAVWELIGEANRYIDEKKPWELKKKPERRDEVSTVFQRLISLIRTVLLLAYPVIPGGAQQFWEILGLPGRVDEQRLDALREGVPAGHKCNPSVVVFQRVDPKVLEGEAPASDSWSAGLQTRSPNSAPAENKSGEAENAALKSRAPQIQADGLITIDDFGKVQLRVGEIRSAAKVEKADKLLHLAVWDGERERSIVAGIAQYFDPAELPGRQVVIVANLQPAKLRGILSEGMLLAASDGEGRLALVSPAGIVAAGAKVK